MKPYIVSGDIALLLNKWSLDNGYLLPDESFFMNLRTEFSNFVEKIFPNFHFISEKELLSITQLIPVNDLVPVSLDRVYFNADIHIDVSRFVDSNNKDCGIKSRLKDYSLLYQLRNLKKNLKEIGTNEIALVDDVIFTGEVIERLIEIFRKMDIYVPVIFAGVGIQEGIDRINSLGSEVICVRRYEEVIDEICERDFYPGVPFCGRSLDDGKNTGVPYLLPFGDPGKWASIPKEWQLRFSGFCIAQTIKVFQEIERCSSKKIRCCDIGRKVFALPEKEFFTDALQSSMVHLSRLTNS